MLHYLFTDLTDLLSFNRQTFTGYILAFRACQASHSYPDDFYTDHDPRDSSSEDNDSDGDLADVSNTLVADFEAFTRRNPRHDLPYVGFTDDLGSREIDRAYD